jgi:predicted Rossmann fold nucleotide-binding protein DprA/Smf involved in DNA uptake
MLTAADVALIEADTPLYPDGLRHWLGTSAPEVLVVRGSVEHLAHPLLGWFSSRRIPPDLVLPCFDLARSLRGGGAAVISGFQSPMEIDCLDILIEGEQPVVSCPARGISEGLMRSERQRAAVLAGRLMFLSGHADRIRRPTVALAEARNRMVAALARAVFIAAATPGGRLHHLAREIANRGQQLFCFDHPANQDLLLLGAHPVDPLSPIIGWPVPQPRSANPRDRPAVTASEQSPSAPFRHNPCARSLRSPAPTPRRT